MFDINNFGILDLSTPDLAIILAIVLLLFGSKKLPELSKGIGTSMRELRKGFGDISDAKDELRKQVNETATNVDGTTKTSGPI